MANPPDEAVRHLATLLERLLNTLPAKPIKGSPRAREIADLRSGARGGGRARVQAVTQLADDAVVMAGTLMLFVQGVADCLQVAGLRDFTVNTPVLSTTVRPTLEIAGQIAWLLDDGVDGAGHARRYIMWRLADLRSRRLLLREFKHLKKSQYEDALADLDREEEEIATLTQAARWQIRQTAYKPKGDIEAAVLLTADGERGERVPKIGEMVGLISSTPATYGFLSASSHGERFGAFYGLEEGEALGDGRVSAKVSGFGLPPNLVIGLACLSTVLTGRRLAAWNGLDSGDLDVAGRALMRSAGIRVR